MVISRSVAWLHRACEAAGLTFAQKPYSLDAAPQKVAGIDSTSSILTIDLIDLKPYLRGEAGGWAGERVGG